MSLLQSGLRSPRQQSGSGRALTFSCLIASFSIFPLSAYSAWFEETTDFSGVEYSGSSFGASWGDLDDDGWPDLWVGNHGQRPDLFKNNGDGTFSRVPLTISSQLEDMHGAAWADFDNDGDQDLFFEVGAGFGIGSGPNQFLINTDGILDNKAAEYGIDYPLGRGRTPLWLDWNADGKLDLLINNDKRPDGLAPTALFSQSKSTFSDSFPITGLTSDSHSSFAQLIYLADGLAPVLLINGNPFPNRAYDLESSPFVDINSAQGAFPSSLSGVNDSAIADFDGDLLSDIFITRVETVSQLILQQGAVLARINVRGDEKGFSLSSASALEIEVNPPFSVNPSEIFIGQQGSNPSSLNFTLSAQESAVHGIMPHAPGLAKGIFIGYEPDAFQWKVLVNDDDWFDVNFVVSSDSSITDVAAIGFLSSDGALTDHMLIQGNTGFVDKSNETGFVSATTCTSVVAEDFDNDMDVDLYLACKGPIENSPNRFFENTGDGVFQLVTDAGGAEGTADGRSESVVAADYDNDGFIDLFITNGFSGPPFNAGPSQLFRNSGNTNHWIGVHLEGTISNRDGIASKVLLTAGGKTQLREHNGGMHKYSQNHTRLHFGLGQNTSIDRVEVIWPSGTQQILRHLDADQFITIVEQSIDNDKPIIEGVPETLTTQDVEYSFEPTSIDNDGDGLIFSITNKPSWAVFDTSTGELSGTPGNDDVGLSSGIEIIADDRRGQPNSLASLPVFDIEVIDVNDGPVVIVPIGVHQGIQDTQLQPLDVSRNFSDPDKDTLTFSIDDLPAGSGIGISTNGVISGTPSDADAKSSPINVPVTASDPSGLSVVENFVLLVEATESNGDGGGNDDTSADTGEDESATEIAAASEVGNENKSTSESGVDSTGGGAIDAGSIFLLLIGVWIRRKAAQPFNAN